MIDYENVIFIAHFIPNGLGLFLMTDEEIAYLMVIDAMAPVYELFVLTHDRWIYGHITKRLSRIRREFFFFE